MSDPIFVGDLVQLMSGGPDMTVGAIDKGKATCTWLGADGEFALEALRFVRRHSTPVGNAASTDKEA
jgi:uncharacterized protein YodC (DUF2158 family)